MLDSALEISLGYRYHTGPWSVLWVSLFLSNCGLPYLLSLFSVAGSSVLHKRLLPLYSRSGANEQSIPTERQKDLV